MSEDPKTCRLCGSSELAALGVIPDSDYFAGRVLAEPIPGGNLWSCSSCGSMFRHPVLPADVYLNLYADGIAEGWSSYSDREDLAIVRSIIAQKSTSGSVLDLGCSSGGFLLTLSAGLEKYGIEPSLAAGAVAAKLGEGLAYPSWAARSRICHRKPGSM
jgi:hypothetical protein